MTMTLNSIRSQFSTNALTPPLLPETLREGEGGCTCQGEANDADGGDEEPLEPWPKSMRNADTEDEDVSGRFSPGVTANAADENLMPPPVFNYAAYRNARDQKTGKVKVVNIPDDDMLPPPIMNYKNRGQ